MDPKIKKAVEARLEQLAQKNAGRLTPEAVVEDARNPRSPLHSFIDWDDKKAAHQWRLDQARALIRSVRVEIHTEAKTISTVRYVRDPSAKEAQGYVPVAKLRDDKDMAREAIESEMSRVLATLERAQGLADALGLADEFGTLLRQATAVLERVRKTEVTPIAQVRRAAKRPQAAVTKRAA